MLLSVDTKLKDLAIAEVDWNTVWPKGNKGKRDMNYHIGTLNMFSWGHRYSVMGTSIVISHIKSLA